MKNEIKHSVDEYFNNRLYDMEIQPPEGAWDKIQDSLKEKKRKRILSIIKAMAATVAILIATGIGYYIGTNNINKNTIANNNISLKNSSKQEVFTANTKTDTRNSLNTQINTNTSIRKSVQEDQNIIGNNKNKSVKNNTTTDIPDYNKPEQNMANIAMMSSKEISKLNNKNYSGIKYSQQYINYALGLNNSAYIENEINNEETPENNQWMVGGNIAPLYSYRDIKNNQSDVSTSSINSLEKPVLAYAGSLNVNYEKSRFRVEVGVCYSKMGVKVTDVVFSNKITTVNAGNVVDPMDDWNTPGEKEDVSFAAGSPLNEGSYLINSTGSIASSGNQVIAVNNKEYDYTKNETRADEPSTTVFNQQFQYIEIPVIAHYKLIDRNIDFSISGGLSTNFLIGNDVYASYQNSTYRYGETENIRKINYSGVAGIAFEMPFTRSLNIKIEPRFRYNLNSLNTNNTVDSHLYSFGVFTGVSYTF
jgi:hypothetical protein